jgi:hypothetical protein
MICKLRDVVGKRDKLYSLRDEVEFDNAFIPTLIPEEEKYKLLKPGIGSQRQSKVVVMSESSFVENPKQGKKPKRVHHLKMLFIDDLNADNILNTVKEQIHPMVELTT